MSEPHDVENRLGDTLQSRTETLAVAESCTGGLVGSLITDVPGSSDYFIGGIISYMNQTKRQTLAVSRESLERHGAISKPVAREMAQHVRDETGATWSVSTTGHAGPTPDATSIPAGSVFIGIAHAGGPEADESYSMVEHHRFDGTRTEVKTQIAKQALQSVLAQLRAGENDG
jgi:nicotinamide-nucleotide amidase